MNGWWIAGIIVAAWLVLAVALCPIVGCGIRIADDNLAHMNDADPGVTPHAAMAWGLPPLEELRERQRKAEQ